MLNKNICIKCYQKHEKKWDEELWKLGVIECPKEEVMIPENKKHQHMWITILAHRKIENCEDTCIHQIY